jgi:hypothetical protein
MSERRAEHLFAAIHACYIPLVGAAAVLFVLPASPATDDTLDAVMFSLAARNHGHAVFTERQFIALLKKPVDSAGDLYFRAPDHLEKNTRTPVAESLVIDKGTLTMNRGTIHHSVALSAYPQVGALIDSLRATLSGDRGSLERTYSVAFTAAGGHWALSLTPRDEKLAYIIREIHITGADAAIDRIETIRADGDRSVMMITQLPDT